MAFARHQFELSQPQSDGEALIVHLQVVSEKMGAPHPMLSGPPLPQGLETLWANFLRLHRNRGSAGSGPRRITDADVFASRQVAGILLNGWQLDVVNRADDIWLSEFAPKPRADA